MRLLFVLCCALATLALTQPAHAQESACVRIDNDAERLACYDTANGRTPRAQPALPQTQSPQAHAPQGGPGGSITGVFRRDQSSDATAYDVARLMRTPDGQVSIVMTNGDIWAAVSRTAQAPPSGAHVYVARLRVGLYVLTREGVAPIEVRKQN